MVTLQIRNLCVNELSWSRKSESLTALVINEPISDLLFVTREKQYCTTNK